MVSAENGRGQTAIARSRAVVLRLGRLTRFVVMSAGLLAIPMGRASAHPLHTTLTDVSIDPRDGTLRIVIRAFADDFSAAAARHAGNGTASDHNAADDVLRSYLMAKLSLVDERNQRVVLAWESVRRQGELLWITVRAPSVKSLRGVKLGSALLFEKFDDQVNIVQAAEGSAHRSMLFTSGDGDKVKALF